MKLLREKVDIRWNGEEKIGEKKRGRWEWREGERTMAAGRSALKRDEKEKREDDEEKGKRGREKCLKLILS